MVEADKISERGSSSVIANLSEVMILFLVLFFIFVLLLALFSDAQRAILTADASLLGIMEALSTPPIWMVRLDYVGFFVPLLFSLLLTARFLMSYPTKSSRSSWIGLGIVLAFSLIFSLVAFELRSMTKYGGGINLLALFAIVGFLSYLAWIPSRREGYYLAYPLGFLPGAISDFESLTHLKSITVFGGLGLLDGDFVLPILYLLAFVLLLKFNDLVKLVNNGKSDERS